MCGLKEPIKLDGDCLFVYAQIGSDGLRHAPASQCQTSLFVIGDQINNWSKGQAQVQLQ